MPEDVVAIGALTDRLLTQAAQTGRPATRGLRAAESGVLLQVALGLPEGQQLPEHDNPGEAFLHVLSGRLQLVAGAEAWEVGAGELLAIPQRPHSVLALEDSTALVTQAHLESS